MSFLGLAFEMGVQDTGFSRGIDDVIKDMDVVQKAVKKYEQVSEHATVTANRLTKQMAKPFQVVSKQIRGVHDSVVFNFDKASSFVNNTISDVGDKFNSWMIDAQAAAYGPLYKMGQAYSIIRNTVKPAVQVFSKSMEAVGDVAKKVAHQSSMLWDGVKTGAVKAAGAVKDFGEKFKQGLGNLGGDLKKFGKGVNSTFDNMAKRVTQFNVANIASNMSALTGETGRLTNGLEAQMTAMMQTTKPIAAELNVSSKEMKRIASQSASIAYSMNTDAGMVANTMKAITLANDGAKKAMNELGMSTKDWVKVVQTTGIDMQDYTAILGDMTTSWGASPKEAAKLIDTLMATGKAAGTGTGALKNAKVQLDELGNIFKSLPPSMARTSDEITSLMESSARMSGVFRMMGDTQEEAIQKGNTVARMFAEQDVAISKALAIGDKTALSENPLLKHMMQLGIGFDEARNIIALGSRDTVAGMQKINDLYAKLGADKRAGVQRALADLSGALGEGASGLSYLAQNTTKGTEALSQMASIAVKGDGALKKFGKDAFSSGLTLQDTYDRAKEAFDTTIRSIARANVRGLVQKQIAGMREAGKEIKALGSDETWGPWVKALSQYKQMGVGGIFASISEYAGVGAKNSAKFGAKVGLIMDTVSQLGSEMAPVMQMLGMTGPLGPLLAAGGIGALLMMDDSTAKDILGPLYDTFDGLKKKVIGLWDKFSPKFLNVWNTQIKPKLVGFWRNDMLPAANRFWSEDIVPAVSQFWNGTFVPYLKEAAPQIGEALWGALKWAWNQIGESTGIIGQAVVGGLVASKAGIVSAMAGPVSSVFTASAGDFMKVLRGPAGLLGLAAAAGIAFASRMDKESAVKKGFAVSKSIANSPGYVSNASQGALMQDLERVKAAMEAERSKLGGPRSWAMKDLGRSKNILQMALRRATAEDELYKTQNQTDILMKQADAALAAGKNTGDSFVGGLKGSLDEGKDKIAEGAGNAAESVTAHSPIEYGPLAGDGPDNAAYRGGYYTMEQFALGVTDSTEMVSNAVNMALDEAVIGSFEEYAVKMEELASRKSMLLEVAKGMVRDMGVTIETSDSEANVDVKKSFEAAMSLPGLAGVTMAIINENAKTLKSLKAIHTELATQTSIMNGSSPPAAAGGKGAPVA
jgi:hypothetical protein